MPSAQALTGGPCARLALRYAVLLGGFLPTVLIVVYVSYMLFTNFDAQPSVALVILAVLLFAVWALWNVILIARKKDPIYDRAAGTAVVRR